MKELEKHLNTLHRLQKYRRGTATMNELNLTPKEIGEAIDYAIRQLRTRRHMQGTDELQEREDYNKLTQERCGISYLTLESKIHNFKNL